MQIKLLNKGLKFIPTPESDTIHTGIKQFLEFKKTMVLQYHFLFHQNNTIPIFKVIFDWDPPEYSYPPLQNYFRHVLKDITNFNMSDMDIRALQELQQYKDIVIKPTDKGGKIVIWPVDQYTKEAHQQLSDTKILSIARHQSYQIHSIRSLHFPDIL